MDFSSIPRALESLSRRQPPLDEAVLEVCKVLQQPPTTTPQQQQQSSSADEPILRTLLHHERWEALAVGLYVSTELLLQKQQEQQQQTTTPSSTSTVYMEGPRVPAMTVDSDTDPTTSTTEPAPEVSASSTSALIKWLLATPEQVHDLCQVLHPVCLKHLEHKEPRVRTLVAKAVGAYVRLDCYFSGSSGEAYAREVYHRLVGSIQQHLETGRDHLLAAEAAAAAVAAKEEEESGGSEAGQGSAEQEPSRLSKASTGALDDTTGWRALETNWQCLASLIAALTFQSSSSSSNYLQLFPFEDDDAASTQVLEDCHYSAVTHVNRHVRAAAMNVLEQWVRAVSVDAEGTSSSSSTSSLLLTDKSSPLRKTIISVVKTGLADNWSQVRMAASVLCRVFLTTLQALHQQQQKQEDDDDSYYSDIYPLLLPRMCLNRYYLAQGVKLYSHETWFLVVKDKGVDLVAKHLPAVVRYYCQMCDADNHAVREAACQAISELAVRLGGGGGGNDNDNSTKYKEKLAGHVEVLLQSLLMCFHDESWPVRDEACMACAILCKSYPEECRSELPLLWGRWVEQLTDQIWSVRQDAAVALGDAVEAYPDELWPKVLELLKQLLPSAREQPAMTKEAFKAHQNDYEAHKDSQLYSCGSLAPKLRKAGAGRIGCTSCGIDRPKAPWEATDGSIYLIRELSLRGTSEESTCPKMTDEILLPLLTELAEVCRVQHFPQSDDLRTTLWRQLPTIAHALGKDRFKQKYMHIFMDLMFRTMDSRSASQLSIHAAGQCAEELSALVGKGIFRGRLEDYQREIFDSVMRERALMPKGPADDSGFSPFGPPGLLDSINKKRFAASAGGH